MIKLIIPPAVLLFIFIVSHLMRPWARKKGLESLNRKPLFEYGRKERLMTPAEHECYEGLVAEMGADYYFFPQIHLDAIVFSKCASNSQLYAFRHINQKSVDFVACAKTNMQPLFAIELDDKSHKHPNRIVRDVEVERILKGAAIPLIRIENRGRIDQKTLARIVRNRISEFAPSL